jgi:hypothetical protein
MRPARFVISALCFTTCLAPAYAQNNSNATPAGTLGGTPAPAPRSSALYGTAHGNNLHSDDPPAVTGVIFYPPQPIQPTSLPAEHIDPVKTPVKTGEPESESADDDEKPSD